jgi:hypothetical protein
MARNDAAGRPLSSRTVNAAGPNDGANERVSQGSKSEFGYKFH